MFNRISSLVPNVEDLLVLEAEEVAGVLIACLSDFGGQINQYNFFLQLERPPQYPVRQEEASQALMEAWSWLEREGLLVRDAHQTSSQNFFLSRRGRRMKSREDLAAYRRASLLPKGQIHPQVATKVYPAFLRGEYDTAVFQAFREVEIAVRDAGSFNAETGE